MALLRYSLYVFNKKMLLPFCGFVSLADSRAGWGTAVYWPSNWRNPQRGLKERREIQPGTEGCSTVSGNTQHDLKTFSPVKKPALCCLIGSWSITGRRPWHGEAPHPLVPNKASRPRTAKYLSARLLLHLTALPETMGDREACHYQEVWTVCRESLAVTR